MRSVPVKKTPKKNALLKALIERLCDAVWVTVLCVDILHLSSSRLLIMKANIPFTMNSSDGTVLKTFMCKVLSLNSVELAEGLAGGKGQIIPTR